MKFNIAFYCESIPFTEKTIKLETSLGGSESALIGMANALSDIGHEVTVFTRIDDPAHRKVMCGVQWLDSQTDFQPGESGLEWDIFISLRFSHIFLEPIQAKYKVLWLQDEIGNGNMLLANSWSVDEFYYVSQFQRDQYESKLPETIKKMGFVTKNGIDLARIDKAIDGIGKVSGQLIYISRPERGLEPLLQIFPKIREKVPHATLKVCRYESMYEPNPAVKSICQWADQAIRETEGVEYLGNLDKDSLYREIAKSELMVYPGVPDFNETSCIAAIEAQACRTPMICSARGGLLETLHDEAGIKIHGDAFSGKYQQEFVENVAFHLTRHESAKSRAYQHYQETGRQWVEQNYRFETIAAEWDTHFRQFFQARLKQNGHRIYQNLMHHDDVLTAGKLAKVLGGLESHQKEVARRNATETPEAYVLDTPPPESIIDSARFDAVCQILPDLSHIVPPRILDFACGNGAMARRLAETYSEAEIHCIDYSEKLIAVANKFITGLSSLRVGSLDQLQDGESFDLIFCGEYLEHTEAPEVFINDLESYLTDEGWLIWTVPTGAIRAELGEIRPSYYGHRSHFEYSDIQSLFSQKQNFELFFLPYERKASIRGNLLGHWIIKHQKGITGEIDYVKKYTLTRPYQSLSVCMITKNEETNLARCLKSVKHIADEIIACDMNSSDKTVEIAEQYGAKVYGLPETWPESPPNTPPPGNFSWARNESIKQASGDWILWIDADEELLGGQALRKYMESQAFDGFVVRQNHLELDAPSHHDKPVRLYRNNGNFKFYGFIHEHAMKSLNEPIEPALELNDAQIVHYGYVTESRRRNKCETRNMHLLALDRKHHPDRHLGQVLLAREYLNFIHWDIMDRAAILDREGKLHPQCVKQIDYAQHIIGIWDKYAPDWRPNLRKLAWPVYQEALQRLGVARKIEVLEGSVESGQVQTIYYRDIREVAFYLDGLADEEETP